MGIAAVAIVSLSAAGWAVWGRGTTPAPRTAEATRAFAEGMRSADRPNRESLASAVAAYERAIALDPSFAPAHAALANTLVVRGVFGGARPDESYPRARAEALRAVELDPTLAEGHVALGHVRVQWDRDWRGAEEAIAARSPSIRTPRVRTCSMPCSSTRWAAPTRPCAKARSR